MSGGRKSLRRSVRPAASRSWCCRLAVTAWLSISSLVSAGAAAPFGWEVATSYSWVYVNPEPQAAPMASVRQPLQYSHMGMLNVLPNGSLAALWQAAPVFWEGSKFQGIHWALSDDAGATWSSPRLLVSAFQNLPIWAPVLHIQNGQAWLFYSVSRQPCWWWGEGGLHYACGGDLMVQQSQDSALTWSAPQVVMSFDEEGGIAKMVANKLGVDSSGQWLLPFWREMGGHNCTNAPGMHGVPGILLSSDQGASWQVVNISRDSASTPTWLIEPAIAEAVKHGPTYAPHTLGHQSGWTQLFRTSAGSIYRSQSHDGRAWTAAMPTALPNPNSKVDMTALDNQTLLVAFNDATDSRSFLTLAASCDAGRSWSRAAVLEDHCGGSFSYPTMQDLPEQETVLVIYSVDFPPSMHQSQFRSKHMEPAGHRTQQSLHWQLTLAAPTRWLRALLLVGQGLCSSVRQALGFADPAGSGSEGRAGVRQHGSQTASVKAWGRASLGMRIARVDRPSLLRVAHTACDKGLS